LGASMCAQESVERTDACLVLAQSHIGAVLPEDLRLRHGQRNSRLAGIAQDELTGLDRSPLPGQGLATAALDAGLVDGVLVPQRIEVSGLRSEILHVRDVDPGEAHDLLARHLEDAPPFVLGIAERTQPDVHLALAKWRIPVLGVVETFVPQLPCPRRHPRAE